MLRFGLVRVGGVMMAAAALALTACGTTVTGGGGGGSGGSGAQGGTGGIGTGGTGGTGGIGTGGTGGGIGGTGGTGGGIGGTGGTGGGIGGTGGTGGGGGSLPECVDGPEVVLAMDRILLGDTDPNGTPNPTNGWKQYGRNIDGLVSTKESVGLCKPPAGGAPAATYPDGYNGIDNSFGKNILPIFLGLTSDLHAVNNERIWNGEFTYLLSISNLGQEACATSSTLYLGANLGHQPFFDGSDVWPIDASSLTDPADPTSVPWEFSTTTLEQGSVEAGPPGQFDLVLRISDFDMVLPIHHARISMQLDADQMGATAGQISGVIYTQDLTDEVAKVAAAFDDSFCDPSSPTLQSILNQLRQGSDILSDGTQDPTKPCDAISIGLGFTMKSAQLGPVAPAAPPPPDPCVP